MEGDGERDEWELRASSSSSSASSICGARDDGISCSLVRAATGRLLQLQEEGTKMDFCVEQLGVCGILCYFV